MDEESEVLKAVKEYVYDRHSDLTRSSIMGFGHEDLVRLKTDGNGYLVFLIDDVKVVEKTVEDGQNTWYVSATIYFKTNDGSDDIEGSTDIYQCYRDGDKWNIEWYAE